MRNTIVASLLGLALVAAGIVGYQSNAYAGDDAPAAKPAAKVTEAPVTAKPATKTPSPIHTMLKWVGSQVMEGDGCGCPSTPEGEKAWRTWYKAENPKLATLRSALLADGWNADTSVAFFKTMAASKDADCAGCDKAGGCDKSKGAAAATGDAGKTGDAASKGGCCGKAGGCDKSKGAAAATGDAGKTGDAASKGGCCGKAGGCSKSKGAAADTGDAGKTGDAAAKSGCCKGKSDCAKGDGCCKKAKGAAADTGDAGTTGDASEKCPCNGKPMKDCSGCDKDSCPCGKDK